MKNEQTPSKPVSEIRFGTIRAAIWKNDGKNGAWYSVTFDRSYRDDAGEVHSSQSFGRDDLLLLAKAADLAHTRIHDLQRLERSDS